MITLSLLLLFLFLVNRCASLPTTTRRSNAVMEYASYWERLLLAEYQETAAELREQRKTWSRKSLEEKGLAVFGASAEPESEQFGEKIVRIIKRGETAFRDCFTKGDVLLLTPQVPNVDPIPKECLVIDAGNDWMTVGVGPTWPPGLYEARRLAGFYQIRLDRAAPQAPLRAQRNALDRMRKGEGGSAATFLANLFNEASTDESMNSQTMTLDVPEEDIRSALTEVKEATSFRPNDSQEDAIVWALQRRISLIRGPPGTGKTKVAALLIATALRLQHDETKPPRVLAVTHSNGAADVLLEALLQMGVPAVRLGRPASVSPNVQHRTVIAMSERMPQVVRLRQQASDMTLDSQERSSAAFELRHMTLDVQQMIVRTAPVVVCSCIGAHQLLENNNTAFPVVVLDEAAQTTEPALICALAASKAEQLVLVGDTRQLPPTITSTDQKLRDTLGVSPMARLETCGVDETTLRIQYRMPPMLLEHPSRYFYKGLVRSAPDNLLMNMRPPAGFPWPSQRPLAFVQTGTGDSEVSHNFGGRSNPTEAQVVARVVSNLLAAGDVDDTSISVLSPYTKQVQLIRSHLATKRNGQDVRVGTVDSFQGQETDVVVFSAVRSNPLRELGFLRDSRRLCVAITRARRGLILVGDQSTLKSCRHWAALLESCEQRGCCMEAKDLEPATETKDTGRQRRQDTLVDLLDKEDEFYGLF